MDVDFELYKVFYTVAKNKHMTKASKELGFVAKYNMDDMAKDAWNWQKNNPNGYDK
mgnify:CR=1 FL=1